MVALPQSFDTKELPDTGGNSVLIPQGNYKAVIVNSEFKQTKDGAGQYLALTVVLTEGQHNGTEFIERLNLVNQNPKAVEIAYKTLARISEALNMTRTPDDSAQLHNKSLMVKVETEAASSWTDNDGVVREGKDKSIIKKYLPLPATGVAAAPAAVAGNSFASAPAAPAAVPQSAPWGG